MGTAVGIRLGTGLLLVFLFSFCYNTDDRWDRPRLISGLGEMPNKYREELPKRCPPPEAKEIDKVIDVFRLVDSNPATDKDFISKQGLKPNRKFPDDCMARGVSVWATKAAAENMRASPRWKNRNSLICRVRLSAGAGKIKQTITANHLTWWPYADFMIVDCCEVVS